MLPLLKKKSYAPRELFLAFIGGFNSLPPTDRLMISIHFYGLFFAECAFVCSRSFPEKLYRGEKVQVANHFAEILSTISKVMRVQWLEGFEKKKSSSAVKTQPSIRNQTDIQLGSRK